MYSTYTHAYRQTDRHSVQLEYSTPHSGRAHMPPRSQDRIVWELRVRWPSCVHTMCTGVAVCLPIIAGDTAFMPYMHTVNIPYLCVLFSATSVRGGFPSCIRDEQISILFSSNVEATRYEEKGQLILSLQNSCSAVMSSTFLLSHCPVTPHDVASPTVSPLSSPSHCQAATLVAPPLSHCSSHTPLC